MPNTPTYILYHGRNTSKDKDSKKIWTRIGAVWPNKSGTLLLDSRVVELEGDAYGATNATQGNPLYQQAFDEAPLVLRDGFPGENAKFLAVRDRQRQSSLCHRIALLWHCVSYGPKTHAASRS